MPKAMLAAMPPRRTTRSSTRNESDTLCSWSGRSCSAKRPGKCIRWSVAIEPVTAIFMGTAPEVSTAVRQRRQPTGQTSTIPLPAGRAQKPGPRAGPLRNRSVERVAAGARPLCVGVVDGEALRVDAVGEVDGGAGEVGRAHPVDHDLDAAKVLHVVAVEGALVEEELIA